MARLFDQRARAFMRHFDGPPPAPSRWTTPSAPNCCPARPRIGTTGSCWCWPGRPGSPTRWCGRPTTTRLRRIGTRTTTSPSLVTPTPPAFSASTPIPRPASCATRAPADRRRQANWRTSVARAGARNERSGTGLDGHRGPRQPCRRRRHGHRSGSRGVDDRESHDPVMRYEGCRGTARWSLLPAVNGNDVPDRSR